MNLEFQLLIIDDNPDNVEQATKALDEYLRQNGFFLRQSCMENMDVDFQQDIADGKKYDLAMVDYNLGREEYTGADMARQLRAVMRYTDIIFYSGEPRVNLLKELADKEVAGVFVATREELDDDLVGMAETIIGKAIDITHMRGIAMANTADMDVRMGNALEQVFSHQELDGKLSDVTSRTFKKIGESNIRIQRRFEEYRNNDDIFNLVEDTRMFTFFHKYQAIMRLVNKLPKAVKNDKSDAINRFRRFNEEIIEKRNILAHVKEVDVDGKTIFRSVREEDDIIIDDEWMKIYRQHLGEHKSVLDTICTTIEDEFGPAGPK